MNGESAHDAIDFDDGPAYERFMGRWSRAAGALFLDWLAPPPSARWLEVGCGTGAFTELVLHSCAPAGLVATDPAISQIEYCLRQPIAERVNFRVVDAHELLFPDSSFDIIASALVLNFVSDSHRSLSEMRRVGCSGGLVAGYVWDFTSDRAPNSCVALGLRQMGIAIPKVPGTDKSTLDFLKASFERAKLEEISLKSFDVSVRFSHFEEFWHTQIPNFSPLCKIIKGLGDANQMKLIDLVRAQLVFDRDGTFSCSVRANAIKARVP